MHWRSSLRLQWVWLSLLRQMYHRLLMARLHLWSLKWLSWRVLSPCRVRRAHLSLMQR